MDTDERVVDRMVANGAVDELRLAIFDTHDEGYVRLLLNMVREAEDYVQAPGGSCECGGI